ncbi:MAG TPA: recombinase family protein [Candidatus Acidoferrales bacterium]|nr:recombinase family protein [Candidatus Acidoferrales bacterium]
MADELFREVLNGSLDPEHVRKMRDDGWSPRAIEWQRAARETSETKAPQADIPFGLRIAADCTRLEENPAEMRILFVMMEMVVQDASLTRMADELNRRGYKTRDASDWTPLKVYNVFPRLVEVSPRIFSDQAWTSRPIQSSRVPWNS